MYLSYLTLPPDHFVQDIPYSYQPPSPFTLSLFFFRRRFRCGGESLYFCLAVLIIYMISRLFAQALGQATWCDASRILQLV